MFVRLLNARGPRCCYSVSGTATILTSNNACSAGAVFIFNLAALSNAGFTTYSGG